MVLVCPKYPSKLDPSFLAAFKEATPPWGPLGYITYKRTYSRRINDRRKEEWWETIRRCVEGSVEIGTRLSKDEMERLFQLTFSLKGMFAGRGLWQLGTDTVRRFGLDSLQNCWVVPGNDPIKPFCFMFNELMLGGGVAMNITPEMVYEMPPVKFKPKIVRKDANDVDFIIPDNREGWVELLRKVLTSYFVTGTDLTYSAASVRSKGALIRGFGGVASGPEDLCNGIDNIIKVLNARHRKKLRPIDAMDIGNIIGAIVVSGNVRRTAQLMLGAHKDIPFLLAKNWASGQIPNWRSMSNNTVACSDTTKLPPEFWYGYEGTGEPYGLLNLDLSRSHGRIADGPNYRTDFGVIGTNPCGEVTLEAYECCNLSTIYLPNLENQGEFLETSGLLYKVQKSISCLPAIHPETTEVVGRNHRLGQCLAGFMQRPDWHDPARFTEAYRALEELDKSYSKDLGVNPSIKLTSEKPDGTTALLAGVSPGVHPTYAPYYLRRIRFASNDPLVDVCRAHGYQVEPARSFDGTINHGTMIAGFPVKAPASAIMARDVSAIKQLEAAAFVQRWWSDNSVSVTVYYKKEELPEIKAWLDSNWEHNMKSVSFLLHSEHGFTQAPLEEITEGQFNELYAKSREITGLIDAGDGDLGVECQNGVCPIK